MRHEIFNVSYDMVFTQEEAATLRKALDAAVEGIQNARKARGDAAQRDIFGEDVLEAPKPKRRVIHVDQGRRATNIVNKVDNPIIRMDNERGDPLAWGGTLTMVCHCGRATCRFVQPKPDRAYVIVEDHVLIIDDEDKREE